MSLEETLLKNNVINRDILVRAQKETKETGISTEEAFLKQGVLESDILSSKSELFGLPAKSLMGIKVPFDILRYIPEESAENYKFIPIDLKEGVLEVGMVNPDDISAREALQFLSSKLNIPFKIFLISPSDLVRTLKDYKSLGGEAEEVLGEFESTIIVPESKTVKPERNEQRLVEDAPTTKLVAVILRHAVEGRASDVHIEPSDKNIRVRFRVDGVLHTSLLLPVSVLDALVARIKILTNMKLDEKRKPQDGRFEANIAGKQIDFRVSTFPSFFGEKIVMRILEREGILKSLEDIGLVGSNLEAVKEALEKPYGLILLTGPTGSGKTTTLYGMLKMLDREKYNIVSLEDPIEYTIEGVSQSQVRPELDYTFASGLRSILRQDPDMIMVGEIRDRETARLAIQAALTGHLVFSTIHTNNAAGVIPRLIDMGVESYLIPPTLILAIAQRLTRTLCVESRKVIPVSGALKETLEKELQDMSPEIKKQVIIPKEIYQAMPSAVCPRGTKGRTGIFEVLKMTTELERLILSNPSETAVTKEAKKQGMITMREDGILKVLTGQIGLDQLIEVT
ncbi:MAG: GspE/PulE family protein [bacterium]|nr:GspE/PulE family protein [bacterium]